MEETKQIKLVNSLTGNVITNIIFTQDMELVDIKDKLIEIDGDNIYYTLEHNDKLIDWTLSTEDFLKYFTNDVNEITINVTYNQFSIIYIPFFSDIFMYNEETEEFKPLTKNCIYSSLVYGQKILLTYINERTSTSYAIYDIICKNSYILFEDISIIQINISGNGKIAAIKTTTGTYIYDATKKYFPEINKITHEDDISSYLTISYDGSIVGTQVGDYQFNIWNTQTGEIINTFNIHPCVSFHNNHKLFGYIDKHRQLVIEDENESIYYIPTEYERIYGPDVFNIISWSSNELLLAYKDFNRINIEYIEDDSFPSVVSLDIERERYIHERDIQIKFSNNSKYFYINIFNGELKECIIYKTDTWILYAKHNIAREYIIDKPWKTLYNNR